MSRGALVCLLVAGCRIHFDEQPVDDARGTDSVTEGEDAGVCGVQLAAGREHIAAIYDDGTLRLWGDNSSGQLGDGTTTNQPSPTLLAMPSPAISAAAGRWHSCAVLDTGQVRCWGMGDSGQIGNGSGVDEPLPVPVATITTAVEVAVAAIHACARLQSGEVYCWGAGGSGRLGTGGTASSTTPVQTMGITDARVLRAGGSTTCAILSDARLVCWGFNQQGGVGVGSMTDVLAPMQPIGLSSVRSVSTRDATTCAVRGDGAVLCFGANDTGQAGSDSGGANLLVPTAVVRQDGMPLVGADEVGQGINHGCARLGSDVWCWGSDLTGQLGDGSAGGINPYATQVSGLPPVTQLAIAAYASCAVDSGGGVWCWGAGPAGQLGDGTFTAVRATPQLSFDACP